MDHSRFAAVAVLRLIPLINIFGGPCRCICGPQDCRGPTHPFLSQLYFQMDLGKVCTGATKLCKHKPYVD